MCSLTTSISPFHFSALLKTRLIQFISFTTSIFILFLFVTFITILFCFKFNFMHNIYCFLQCFRILIILNSLLNVEIMYQFPIFSLVWSYHENYCQPYFKWIFFISIISSAWLNSLSFLNSFAILTKLTQKGFYNYTFHNDIILFKPIYVLHQSLFLLLPSIHHSLKIFC